MKWQAHETKQRFSELVRRALDEGPQVVTRHGQEVVVVVAADEYLRSQEARPPQPDFKEFVLSGPDLSQLDLTRTADLPREIDFGFDDE